MWSVGRSRWHWIHKRLRWRQRIVFVGTFSVSGQQHSCSTLCLCWIQVGTIVCNHASPIIWALVSLIPLLLFVCFSTSRLAPLGAHAHAAGFMCFACPVCGKQTYKRHVEIFTWIHVEWPRIAAFSPLRGRTWPYGATSPGRRRSLWWFWGFQ